MGFNNGYDSGYADCELDNRKRWEDVAYAKGFAAGASEGGGGSADTAAEPRLYRLSTDVLIDGGVVTISGPIGFDSSALVTHTVAQDGDRIDITLNPPDGGWRVGDTLVIFTNPTSIPVYIDGVPVPSFVDRLEQDSEAALKMYPVLFMRTAGGSWSASSISYE